MKKTLLAIAVVAAGFSANAQIFSENWTTPQTWGIGQSPADTDTNNWFIASTAAFTTQGNLAVSESWLNDGSTNGVNLTPDNFLFSPVIDLSAITGNVSVSFKVGSPEGGTSIYYEEYLTVYAYDGVNGVAAATPIHDQVLTAGGTMFSYTYNISSLAGADSLILAFRHHNCTGQNFIVLDDIVVSNSLSINENVVSANVYPNPANDVLNIIIADEIISSVSVISMDGKEVAVSSNGIVDVSELKSGMYIYRVTTTSGKLANGNFAKK